MDRIQFWPNQSIVYTIQQLEEARQVDVNVQILLSMINGRNLRMTTVASQGNEELHQCGDLDDRRRWQRQWYEFCNHVWGGVRDQMAD